MNGGIKNKYNRSFIGFMEQCDDGEWCKTSEAEELLRNYEIINHNLEFKLSIKKTDLETEKDLTAILVGVSISMTILWISTLLYFTI